MYDSYQIVHQNALISGTPCYEYTMKSTNKYIKYYVAKQK